MSSTKEALLSRLLQPESVPFSSGKPSLIQIVGGDAEDVPSLPTPNDQKVVPVAEEAKPKSVEKKPDDDQPSILEMMMAAQREAKLEKEKEKATEEAQASVKPLGGGFKKGFFGGGASKPKAKPTTTSTTTSASTTGTAPAKTASTPVAKPDVVEVKKSTTTLKSNPLVFDEVQKAMDEDTHPLLKQLQSNGTPYYATNLVTIDCSHNSHTFHLHTEWMTPDLSSNFQSNKIVSNGFKDPKCMAAMQLLQKSPKEAQARYQNDPEVSLFLQEFAKLMAGHFEALGSASGGNSGGGNSGNSSVGSGVQEVKSNRVEEISMDVNKGTGTSGGGIQEIGPLHAQVLQKKAQAGR